MASLILNRSSGEDYGSQWRRYLQQQEFTSEITSAVHSEAASYRDAVREALASADSSIATAAAAIVGSLNEGFETINSSIGHAADQITERLESGFAAVENQLASVDKSIDRVDESLRHLGSMLGWRLSLVSDQMKVSNLLLENVAELLRIPDVQKERQYHIEQGLRHYQNALRDPDLYRDALENLLEAEKREKTDYIILHRIGMIYLYVPDLLDLSKAEDYFRRASKYAAVEVDPRSTRLVNILAGDITRKLIGQSTPSELISRLAADSFLQAAIACFAQGHFAETAKLTGKALSLAPAHAEAGYTHARALVASGDRSNLVNVLSAVIATDSAYSVKAAADWELSSVPEVQSLLVMLRDRAVAEATNKIRRCRAQMLPESTARSLIGELESLAGKNSYLDAVAALRELEREREWRQPLSLDLGRATARHVQATALYTGLFGSEWNTFTTLGILEVIVWDVGTSAKKWEKQHQRHVFQTLALSPDGRFVAIGHERGILVLDGRDGAEIPSGLEDRDEISALAFNREGSLLISSTAGYSKNSVSILDVSTWREIEALASEVNGSRLSPYSLAVSPDGTILAIPGLREEILLWHIPARRLLRKLRLKRGRAWRLVFTPDGRAVVATDETNVFVCSVDNAENDRVLAGHPSKIRSLAVDTTANLLASGSEDGIIKMWDIETWQEVASLRGRPTLYSLSFNCEGTILAAIGSSGVDVWSVSWLSAEEFIRREPEFKSLAHAAETRRAERRLAKAIAAEAQQQAESEARRKAEAAEEAERQRREARQKNIESLIAQADAEAQKQQSKWFGKPDYRSAVRLYDEAVSLGSELACIRIAELTGANVADRLKVAHRSSD